LRVGLTDGAALTHDLAEWHIVSYRFRLPINDMGRLGEPSMDARPRTKAAKKRRVRLKEERRLKKTRSRVMPMLSRPKKLKANKRAASA
jgi:hypothetical protein